MIYEREASKSLTKAGLSIIQQSWLLWQLLMGPWGGYDYFLFLLGKSSIWFTKKHFFKIITYFFNTSKLCHFIRWFHRSKDFEAMKAGRSAIWPWLSCPYDVHTLLDLPSSVVQTEKRKPTFL